MNLQACAVRRDNWRASSKWLSCPTDCRKLKFCRRHLLHASYKCMSRKILHRKRRCWTEGAVRKHLGHRGGRVMSHDHYILDLPHRDKKAILDHNAVINLINSVCVRMRRVTFFLGKCLHRVWMNCRQSRRGPSYLNFREDIVRRTISEKPLFSVI